MTREELNTYVHSIGNLKGPRIDSMVDAGFFEIGDGWNQLVHDLIAELLLAGWDKQCYQVKEKFGGLRFYIGGGNDEIFNIIDKYEAKSLSTCEICGGEGRLRTDRSWVLTLCDGHARKVERL